MEHTHSLSEWAAFLSIGVAVWSAGSGLVLLTVEADLDDFDPRPAVRRALAAAHQGAVHAGHDLNRAIATIQRTASDALREAALTVAALLTLLFPAAGGTR